MAIEWLILVIDDEPMTRRVIERAIHLVYDNAVVQEAASVYEALRILQHTPVTAIITDYNLPDGTGLEILSASTAQAPSRRILALSGDPTVKQTLLAAGASQFLTKPVSLSDLLAAIKLLF